MKILEEETKLIENNQGSRLKSLEDFLIKMAVEDLMEDDAVEMINDQIQYFKQNGGKILTPKQAARDLLYGGRGPSFGDSIMDNVDWERVYNEASDLYGSKSEDTPNKTPNRVLGVPGHRPSPYERTKAQVYATGNRWAIDNFNATHN